MEWKLRLKLSYDRRSVGQSVLVQAPIWSPWPDFCFLSDDCGFLVVWRPLWREDGSVIYCTIASRPCQSSHSWVEVQQNSWPYFTVSSETPPTWRARSLYLYPPGTGWPNYTPGHWVPFCRLLRLAGQRWRYSNPPPHGEECDQSTVSYIGRQFVPHRNRITSFSPASTRGRVRSFYYIIYRNSVCTSQESHYVILNRLHTGGGGPRDWAVLKSTIYTRPEKWPDIRHRDLAAMASWVVLMRSVKEERKCNVRQ
jgi:hypothetical protein